MKKLGLESFPPGLMELFLNYEKGPVSTTEFLQEMKHFLPGTPREEIISGWNSILLEFPDHRLEFIREFSMTREQRLFLLSNTNELHIEYVIKQMGHTKFNAFRDAFEEFYLSYEMGMRKPDEEIFEFVGEQMGLHPENTLFIDDTEENTQAAGRLGWQTWNLRVGVEEITELPRRYAL
jgi:putative hydrolase of the HAD superfamily